MRNKKGQTIEKGFNCASCQKHYASASKGYKNAQICIKIALYTKVQTEREQDKSTNVI